MVTAAIHSRPTRRRYPGTRSVSPKKRPRHRRSDIKFPRILTTIPERDEDDLTTTSLDARSEILGPEDDDDKRGSSSGTSSSEDGTRDVSESDPTSPEEDRSADLQDDYSLTRWRQSMAAPSPFASCRGEPEARDEELQLDDQINEGVVIDLSDVCRDCDLLEEMKGDCIEQAVPATKRSWADSFRRVTPFQKTHDTNQKDTRSSSCIRKPRCTPSVMALCFLVAGVLSVAIFFVSNRVSTSGRDGDANPNSSTSIGKQAGSEFAPVGGTDIPTISPRYENSPVNVYPSVPTISSYPAPSPAQTISFSPSVVRGSSLSEAAQTAFITLIKSKIMDVYYPTSSISPLDDEQSPQYKAMEWMINDDTGILYLLLEDEYNLKAQSLVIQRYVLGVLGYSLSILEYEASLANGDRKRVLRSNRLISKNDIRGPYTERQVLLQSSKRERSSQRLLSQNSSLPFLSSEHECDWRGIECSFLSENSSSGHWVVTSIQYPNAALVGELPSELAALKYLQVLNLYNNLISGTVPTSYLTDLTALYWLDLSTNSLQGTIPLLSPHLEYVYLSENHLSGSLPLEETYYSDGSDDNLVFYDLPDYQLKHLFLHHNNLNGSIPEGIGHYTLLERLVLSNNTLDNIIPQDISHLKNLTYLDLRYNTLSGSIPSTTYLLSSLRTLYLTGNSLEGTLPGKLGQLSGLESLWLDQNMLTGRIKAQLSDLPNLTELLLQHNSFKGTMPSSICDNRDSDILLVLEADCMSDSDDDDDDDDDGYVECSCCSTCY